MGEPIKSVGVSPTQQPLAELVPLEPLKISPRDSYLKVVSEKKKCPSETKTRWIARDQLEAAFPGVLFRGEQIFVEEGVFIAPGVIIDTEDDPFKKGKIEVKGTSTIASGVVLRGDVTIIDGKLRAGSFVSGVVQLTETTVGRGASIVGDEIVLYRAVILGAICGNTISIDQATITSEGSLVGSSIRVYPETVIVKMEVGSNKQFGKEESLAELVP